MAAPTGQPTSSALVDGWEDLFDGHSTDALRGYGRSSWPTGHWVIDGDALRAVPGPGTDLISRDAYRDFELEFEWRVSAGGNSGVMYRVAETEEPPWTSGPEYQILDDSVHRDGRVPATSAGALYDLIPPGPEKSLMPVGSFNSGRIVVRDGRVEHWLNGAMVVTYRWNEADVRARIAASKFAELGGFMASDEGHIVLQHHGEEVWLRAVRIRRLVSP